MRFVVDLSCAAALGLLASACFETSQPDRAARDDAGVDAETESPGERDGGEPDGGTGREDAGDDDGIAAFATSALAPDRDCIYSAEDGSTILPVGAYDIGGSAAPAGCTAPYVVYLQLRASGFGEAAASGMVPNVLQVHSAEVQLMTRERETIAFDQGDTPLPNPFLAAANTLIPLDGDGGSGRAVLPIETIPSEYARQLDAFAGEQILAEIRLQGTTLADVDVDFLPFVYPIELCAGCLSICESQLDAMNRTRGDVVGDQCDDNAGADGRICIDLGC